MIIHAIPPPLSLRCSYYRRKSIPSQAEGDGIGASNCTVKRRLATGESSSIKSTKWTPVSSSGRFRSSTITSWTARGSTKRVVSCIRSSSRPLGAVMRNVKGQVPRPLVSDAIRNMRGWTAGIWGARMLLNNPTRVLLPLRLSSTTRSQITRATQIGRSRGVSCGSRSSAGKNMAHRTMPFLRLITSLAQRFFRGRRH